MFLTLFLNLKKQETARSKTEKFTSLLNQKEKYINISVVSNKNVNTQMMEVKVQCCCWMSFIFLFRKIKYFVLLIISILHLKTFCSFMFVGIYLLVRKQVTKKNAVNRVF